MSAPHLSFPGPAASRPGAPRQRGWSQVEVILVAFLGITLVLAGGYLFRTQIGGYQDIKNQADIQGGLKKALQGMTRQISNAGGLLPDPLQEFSPQATRFTFAYMDLSGRFCAPQTMVVVSFYSRRDEDKDALMQDIACKDGASQSRRLAAVPAGGLDLAFRYLDKDGALTNKPARIKAVEVDLGLRTGKTGARAQRARRNSIRVQCVNL